VLKRRPRVSQLYLHVLGSPVRRSPRGAHCGFRIYVAKATVTKLLSLELTMTEYLAPIVMHRGSVACRTLGLTNGATFEKPVGSKIMQLNDTTPNSAAESTNPDNT